MVLKTPITSPSSSNKASGGICESSPYFKNKIE